MNYNDYFDLNEKTGKLTFKPRPAEDFATERASKTWNTRFAGKEAGYIHASSPHKLPYYVVKVKDKKIAAHRVIDQMINGPNEGYMILHRNGNVLDNRPCNLMRVSVERYKAMVKGEWPGLANGATGSDGSPGQACP